MNGFTEDDFNEIELAASKAMREWARGYVCQDINVRHHISWWIMKETERRVSERCAALIEDNMLVGDEGEEKLIPRSNPGNKLGLSYASAIRALSPATDTEGNR